VKHRGVVMNQALERPCDSSGEPAIRFEALARATVAERDARTFQLLPKQLAD